VDKGDDDYTALSQIWNEANWGPQDASHPKPDLQSPSSTS
jgi:hypothetical protein